MMLNCWWEWWLQRRMIIWGGGGGMIGDWVYFLFIPLIGLWPEDMAGPLWPRALPLHYPTLVLHQREKIWSKSIDAAASCALSSNSESGRRKGPTAFCRKSPPPSCHHLAWGELASVKFSHCQTGKVDTTLWKKLSIPIGIGGSDDWTELSKLDISWLAPPSHPPDSPTAPLSLAASIMFTMISCSWLPTLPLSFAPKPISMSLDWLGHLLAKKVFPSECFILLKYLETPSLWWSLGSSVAVTVQCTLKEKSANFWRGHHYCHIWWWYIYYDTVFVCL